MSALSALWSDRSAQRARLAAMLACAALAGCSASGSPQPALLHQLADAPPADRALPQVERVYAEPVRDLVLPLPLALAQPAPKPRRSREPTGQLEQERAAAVPKLGKPYQVAGRWYTPRHQPDYHATGIASWYGNEFHGRRTANGEVFNSNRLTAAHPTLPMPSYVEVTAHDTGRRIIVRVNDRGPYAHGRILDLSRRAAELLGFAHKGMGKVTVRYVGPAPLGADDSFEQQYLAAQPWSKGGPRIAQVLEGWDALVNEH